MGGPIFPDVVVNGEVIPRQLIASEAQNHRVPPGKPGLAWQMAARALAVRTLLLQEARRRGANSQPRDLGRHRKETAEDAQIRCLLEEAIVTSTPGEAEIRKEWARAPERFRAPPLWEASHILIERGPTDATSASRARLLAVQLSRQVADAPEKFSDIAARHSDCPSKSSGGFLGQIRPGDTAPEFEAALRGLAKGMVTKAPVETRYGYHIIRLDAAAEGAQLPFEAVRGKISDAMEKRAWACAAKEFVDELLAAADLSGVRFDARDTGRSVQ